MSPNLWMNLLSVAIFLGMAGLYAGGHQLAVYRERKGLMREADGLTGAALFALFGLMVAFSISGSIGRLEARRQLMLQEVNAIGTAYLRLDLLPAEAQASLRPEFREYCQVRRDSYVSLPDAEARDLNDRRTAEIQQRIWQRSISATADAEPASSRMLVVPALNAMIDLSTSSWIAARTHVPLVVIATIFAVALYCAWLAGYSIREVRNFGWVNMLGLSGVTALILHVMLDIEFPRLGFVNLDDYNVLFDQLLLTMR